MLLSGTAVRHAPTRRFLRDAEAAPTPVKRALQKQLAYLLRDLRHPSLHAKKYDEARGIWQARVDGSWRFYFRIEGDAYVLLAVIPHPK